MSSNLMQGPCGGPNFRFTDDGYIEVAGNIYSYGTTGNHQSVINRVTNWKDLIDQDSAKYSVAPAIIAGFMAQESGGNPNVQSPAPANAIGLMQIITSTGYMWGNKYLGRSVSAQELFEPEINIELGTAGIADYMKQTGNNIVKVAAYYNSGKNQCGTAHECSPSKWDLITNCGYIDGVIAWTNTMIESGNFSGNLISSKGNNLFGIIYFGCVATIMGFTYYGLKHSWFKQSYSKIKSVIGESL